MATQGISKINKSYYYCCEVARVVTPSRGVQRVRYCLFATSGAAASVWFEPGTYSGQVNTIFYPLVLVFFQVILRSMRSDMDDIPARNALNCLGNFIGTFTLARNRPILHDDLNMKDLLFEAYHKGSIPLHYVVPFISRVLRGAAKSLAFRPPSPYTVAILRVLRELYDTRDIKVKLKFEIEILFKVFDITVESVQPADFLNNRNHLSALETQYIFLIASAPTQPQQQQQQHGPLANASPAPPIPTSSTQQIMPYDPSSLVNADFHPRTASMAAFAEHQHQHQRFASMAASQQDQPMYAPGQGRAAALASLHVGGMDGHAMSGPPQQQQQPTAGGTAGGAAEDRRKLEQVGSPYLSCYKQPCQFYGLQISPGIEVIAN